MASSIALRRATGSTLFKNLLQPLRSASVAPSVTRSNNTNTQMTNFDDDDGDSSIDVSRRSDSSVSRRRDTIPSLFSDVFDPFSPATSLSQVLNLMDQFMDNPFMAASRGIGAGPKRGWDVKEEENALYLRIDMPGLSKEHVKVTVEQNTLIIRGEEKKESEEEEESGRRRYSSRIDLPPKLYKVDAIKAEMKNGVLKVVVPKVKEEERKDVVQVKID